MRWVGEEKFLQEDRIEQEMDEREKVGSTESFGARRWGRGKRESRVYLSGPDNHCCYPEMVPDQKMLARRWERTKRNLREIGNSYIIILGV